MMAIDEDVHYQDELGLRSSEIGGLREELWGARDRLNEAETRTQTLELQIAKLQTEISIRRAKSNGMEDSVALQEAKGEDAHRAHKREAAANVAEIARRKQDIAAAEDACRRALARVEEERNRKEAITVEFAGVRGRLEAAQQNLRLARQERQREEAAEEAQQRRLAAGRREQAEARLREVKELMSGLDNERLAAMQQVEQAESKVTVAKDKAVGLSTAVQHTLDNRKTCEHECVALERALHAAKGRESEAALRSELADMKAQTQRFLKAQGETKRAGAMSIQGIQGALDETRRMLTDHLDQTTRVPPDSSLVVLKVALTKAEDLGEERVKAGQRVQERCQELRLQVAEAEAAATAEVASERSRLGHRRSAALAEELAAERRALESAQTRERAAREALERIERSTLEAETSSREVEALLRHKLNQLRVVLKQKAAAAAPAGRSWRVGGVGGH